MIRRRQFLGSLAAAPAALLPLAASALPDAQATELDRLARAWVAADREVTDSNRRARELLAARFNRRPTSDEEAEAQEACGVDAAFDELSRHDGPLVELMAAAGIQALRVGDDLVVSSLDFDDNGRAYRIHGDLTLIEAPRVRALGDGPSSSSVGGRR